LRHCALKNAKRSACVHGTSMLIGTIIFFMRGTQFWLYIPAVLNLTIDKGGIANFLPCFKCCDLDVYSSRWLARKDCL
jgi:hypothetical protein